MKKLRLKRQSTKKNVVPTRITNETVAEHRERILAGGRRFKYPMQYARHRLVITTVIITVVAFILMIVVGWWQLYSVQNTNTFFYRVTRVLPLPVAAVDGEQVRYSDYLMYYNSSAHYSQQSEQVDLNSKDGQRQKGYIKQKSMDIVIENAFAAKLAREKGISVSEERIDQVTDAARNTPTGRISQQTYDASALSILGWTPAEYRQATKNKLLLQDVSYAVDAAADKRQKQVAAKIAAGETDLAAIAAALNGDQSGIAVTGVSGLVPLTNQDAGLSAAAGKLEKGAVSSVIRTATGDGYYFVKLLEKTDTQLSYEYLQIPLTEFTKQLAAVKEAGKVEEYISISRSNDQPEQ